MEFFIDMTQFRPATPEIDALAQVAHIGQLVDWAEKASESPRTEEEERLIGRSLPRLKAILDMSEWKYGRPSDRVMYFAMEGLRWMCSRQGAPVEVAASVLYMAQSYMSEHPREEWKNVGVIVVRSR